MTVLLAAAVSSASAYAAACSLWASRFGGGGLWERHCDAHLRRIGFKEMSSWRSVYLHDQLSVLLVVYVDDFLTAGPTAALPKAWGLTRPATKMEAPEPYGLFLGCMNEISEERVVGAGQVRKVTYKSEAYLKKRIEKYLGVLPPGSALRNAPTPFQALQGRLDTDIPSNPKSVAR